MCVLVNMEYLSREEKYRTYWSGDERRKMLCLFVYWGGGGCTWEGKYNGRRGYAEHPELVGDDWSKLFSLIPPPPDGGTAGGSSRVDSSCANMTLIAQWRPLVRMTAAQREVIGVIVLVRRPEPHWLHRVWNYEPPSPSGPQDQVSVGPCSISYMRFRYF